MSTLRDEILAGGFDLANRDDVAIAAALSVGRTKLVETRIGYGAVLSVLGADAGAAVLDALEQLAAVSPPIKWAMRLLSNDRLDVGNQETRAQIDKLVAGGAMTQEQATAIKKLAVVDDIVSPQEVSDVLRTI